MNTATRAYAKGYAIRKPSITCSARQVMWLGCLICVLLASALAVVYVADVNRLLTIQYKRLQHQEQQYQIEKEQLLLKESAWSVQAKIQNTAAQRLGMVVPLMQDIVFVSEEDSGKTRSS